MDPALIEKLERTAKLNLDAIKKNQKISAINETANQEMDKLGAVYIKQELQNKQLWESYSNMSDASLSDMQKIFAELNKMQADLLSGKGISEIAKAAGVSGEGFASILSSLSGSKDMKTLSSNIDGIYSQLGNYDNQRITQSGVLSKLNESQVKSLKMFLQVLISVGF